MNFFIGRGSSMAMEGQRFVLVLCLIFHMMALLAVSHNSLEPSNSPFFHLESKLVS